MKKILLTWMGTRDLKSVFNFQNSKSPVMELLKCKKYKFDEVHILHGFNSNKTLTNDELDFIVSCENNSFFEKLEKLQKNNNKIDIQNLWRQGAKLIDSILEKDKAAELFENFLNKEKFKPVIKFHTQKYINQDDTIAIYKIVDEVLDDLFQNNINPEITFFTSPGTSAMQFIWGAVASLKSDDNIRLLAFSNPKTGFTELKKPFRLQIEKIPKPNKKNQKNLLSIYYQDIDCSKFENELIMKSNEMKKCISEVAMYANYEFPMLLLGETGVGKTTIASIIHKASNRKGEFVEVNCSAIPDSLIEGELFGFKKGAFTDAKSDKLGAFQRAHNGTLFLDEIGEINEDIQIKLLTALQGKITPLGGKSEKINVRIITATNKNLNSEVANGKFRSDLFYRLAVNIIKIPPMRERLDDLDACIDFIINETNNKCSKIENWNNKTINTTTKKYILENCNLKGNFRELESIIRSAMKIPIKKIIELDDIKDAISNILIPEIDNTLSDSQWILNTLSNKNFNFKKESEIVQLKIIKILEVHRAKKDNIANLLSLKNQDDIGRVVGYTRQQLKNKKLL